MFRPATDPEKKEKKSSSTYIFAIVGRWDDSETSDLDANYYQ